MVRVGDEEALFRSQVGHTPLGPHPEGDPPLGPRWDPTLRATPRWDPTR